MYIISLIFFFLLPAQAEFKEITDADVSAMFERIQKVQKMVNVSGGSTLCEPSAKKTCSLEQVCDQLSESRNNFYLYKDAQGFSIPNYQLLYVMEVAEICAETMTPLQLTQDPFVYFDQFFTEKSAGGSEALKKNTELLQARIDRSKLIFEDTQKRVIKLLNNRKTKQNQAEIDNLIARVRSVQLEIPKISTGYDLRDLAEEGCEMPNAFYYPQGNTIKLCPQLLNTPEGTLQFILAHEFGHAIDPCFSGFPYDEKGLVDNEGVLTLPSEEKQVSLAGIPAEKYPFASVVSCLKSSNSLGARSPSESEILSRIEKYDKESGDASITDRALSFLMQENESDLSKRMGTLKNCMPVSKSGDIQEGFSDWVGAEVLGDRIAETQDRQKARELSLSVKAYFASHECSNLREGASQKLNQMLENKCLLPPTAQKISEYVMGEEKESVYPKTSKRINRVFMGNAKIKSSLACQSSARQCK